MKSIKQITYKNNRYYYHIDNEQIKLLNTSTPNKEQMKMWQMILKNDSLVNDMILSYGYTDKNYQLLLITCPQDDDCRSYEITRQSVKDALTTINNYAFLSNHQKRNLKKLLDSLSPNYLANNINTPIIDNISINDILTNFEKELTVQVCLKKFAVSPERLCNILEELPFFINANSNQDETILKMVPVSNERKERVLYNIQQFIYRHEEDTVSKIDIYDSSNYVKKFKINEKFSTELLNEIPNWFTKTQKIYYIYRRLCQILTYDEMVYAGNQKRTYNIKHNIPERISKIDENDNIVVCYNATVLLALFCQKLDIPFTILSEDTPANIRNYGKEHLNLRIKTDDYIIRMDPTTGLINSDLAYEKTRGYIQCFWEENICLRNVDKIESELETVDRLITLKEKELGYIQLQEKLAKMKAKKYENKTIDEKIEELIYIILNNHLPKVDSLRYVLDASKIIFNGIYNDFVSINFASYYQEKNYKMIPQIAYVIKYNATGLNQSDDTYICIIANKVLKMSRFEYDALKKEHLMTNITTKEEANNGVEFENNKLILK